VSQPLEPVVGGLPTEAELRLLEDVPAVETVTTLEPEAFDPEEETRLPQREELPRRTDVLKAKNRRDELRAEQLMNEEGLTYGTAFRRAQNESSESLFGIEEDTEIGVLEGLKQAFKLQTGPGVALTPEQERALLIRPASSLFSMGGLSPLRGLISAGSPKEKATNALFPWSSSAQLHGVSPDELTPEQRAEVDRKNEELGMFEGLFRKPLVLKDGRVITPETGGAYILRTVGTTLAAPAQELFASVVLDNLSQAIGGEGSANLRGLTKRSDSGTMVSDFLVRVTERIQRGQGTMEDFQGFSKAVGWEPGTKGYKALTALGFGADIVVPWEAPFFLAAKPAKAAEFAAHMAKRAPQVANASRTMFAGKAFWKGLRNAFVDLGDMGANSVRNAIGSGHDVQFPEPLLQTMEMAAQAEGTSVQRVLERAAGVPQQPLRPQVFRTSIVPEDADEPLSWADWWLRGGNKGARVWWSPRWSCSSWNPSGGGTGAQPKRYRGSREDSWEGESGVPRQ